MTITTKGFKDSTRRLGRGVWKHFLPSILIALAASLIVGWIFVIGTSIMDQGTVVDGKGPTSPSQVYHCNSFGSRGLYVCTLPELLTKVVSGLFVATIIVPITVAIPFPGNVVSFLFWGFVALTTILSVYGHLSTWRRKLWWALIGVAIGLVFVFNMEALK